jgi:hypothetical protein
MDFTPGYIAERAVEPRWHDGITYTIVV